MGMVDGKWFYSRGGDAAVSETSAYVRRLQKMCCCSRETTGSRFVDVPAFT